MCLQTASAQKNKDIGQDMTSPEFNELNRIITKQTETIKILEDTATYWEKRAKTAETQMSKLTHKCLTLEEECYRRGLNGRGE